jgi:4a-hydroxytetrahydrobiopterin dehydratase
MASNTPAPRFADGEDPHELSSDTTTLQQQGWALDAEGMGVTKTFHFKSYFKAVVCTMSCVMRAFSIDLF